MDIEGLFEEYLAEFAADNPTFASSVGIDGYDHMLPDLSATAISKREALADEWVSRFRAESDAELTLDQRIDRDLLISSLVGRQVVRDWEAWRRDPATYLGPCLSGVFSLFLHRVHDESDLARFAAARLRLVPEVLAQARANLDAGLASRLVVERGAGQCGAGVGYARNLVPAEVAPGPARDDLAAAGEIAAVAFEDFAVFLRDFAESASGDWALGDERYSALLERKELLGYGAVEMRERGRAAYAELDEEMSQVATRVDGRTDWRAVMSDLNKDHPPTPEAMRAEYEEWTERARQFLVDNELVTLPDGERCLVEPSPPFQRPIMAVASYSSPPAFKATLTGHFFVPFPPEGESEEGIQKRLETNSRASIPAVAVHEAYPGHHWHLTWAQQNPRPLRRVFGTSYFSEGWALYAEKMLSEEGFFADPRHQLAQLDARIFRAARIIVDTSLHIGDMTFDEAVGFMQKNASLSEPTAKAEVGRYCSWPTQAPSYLTGSLEIERIRARYFAEGRGDLRKFNDAIAGSGILPIALAEAAVLS